MNKKDALLKLVQSLEDYLQQGFRFHSLFMKEFKKPVLANRYAEMQEMSEHSTP